MKILLLVDIQNDFCPGGALEVPDGDGVVEVANALMQSGDFDCVIATKDYHPSDHVSFVDNHSGGQPFEVRDVDDIAQVLWPRHCEQGTQGAEFHPNLDATRITYVVEKGTQPKIDSYSGFFDNARQNETRLKSLLNEITHGVASSSVELVVCGLALDYCVKATALDAAELGFDTSVVIDACRAVNINEGDDLKALQELARANVTIVESRELLPTPSRSREHAKELHP